MSLGVNIIGAYNTRFGRLEEETIYTLYESAAKGAIQDSGIDVKEIDAVFVGNYSGGSFNNQEHIAPFGVNIFPELRHKPMYRTENACASGTSAVHIALMAIKSGMIKKALVVGVEKMNSLDTKETTKALAKASYWEKEGENHYTFPGLFAEYAKGWMHHFGYSVEDVRPWLAEISSKAYFYGARNPLAHMQKERTAEEILQLPEEKNPVIADPLRLHDCSLISDGAAALILACEAATPSDSKSVAIKGINDASDYLNIVDSKKPNYFLEGAGVAVNKALDQASMSIQDIQLAEVHDCFSITELLAYSALGLVDSGREFEALEDRRVYNGGPCVINPSGGLKAKGHPVGATGASMHALIYKQLIDEPIGEKVENATAGLVLNIGGSGASNMVSVLERRA